MCGIVGIASSRPYNGDRTLLTRGCQAMSHRGPDGTGEWWSKDGQVGLAHRRLAIIDLSPGGAQPMTESTERLHITLNGEIYNYRELRDELASLGHSFRTASD